MVFYLTVFFLGQMVVAVFDKITRKMFVYFAYITEYTRNVNIVVYVAVSTFRTTFHTLRVYVLLSFREKFRLSATTSLRLLVIKGF